MLMNLASPLEAVFFVDLRLQAVRAVLKDQSHCINPVCLIVLTHVQTRFVFLLSN